MLLLLTDIDEGLLLRDLADIRWSTSGLLKREPAVMLLIGVITGKMMLLPDPRFIFH